MRLDPRWRALIGVAIVVGLAFWLARVLQGGGALPRSAVAVTRTTAPRAPSASTARPTPRRYSGNGTQEIGTVTVTEPSSISWTCSHCAAFGLSSAPSGSSVIAVSSTRPSGRSAVDPGTYRAVRVISNGDWSIRITAGQ